MHSRLLIINCSSPYFVYVPIGTFGLCDYLDRQGIEVRVINPALYNESMAHRVIEEQLQDLRPTHVGLILHWQEAANGMLKTMNQVKAWNKHVSIICGGFTAGYFGEDLLQKYSSLDYIVKGDPEIPMALLLAGQSPEDIPNLIYREAGMVRSSASTWLIDQKTLDDFSFVRLEYLVDYDLYLKKVATKLGFPIFIGRGCIYNCDYCGGSCRAFERHSGRSRPVARSLGSIIDDLKRLKDHADILYICYEVDLNHVRSLFETISNHSDIAGHFMLNYGAWHLLDRDFLSRYKEAFKCSASCRPLIEFSPEVYDDAHRKKIKNFKTYTLEELVENIDLINDMLDQHVLIKVFFSRYHDTDQTLEALKREVAGIYRLKHHLAATGRFNVKVCYDHLSTDIGSRYWEKYVPNFNDFDTLLRLKGGIDAETCYQFPVDNLCFYIPESLPEAALIHCEALIHALEGLEKDFYALFHILFFCLGDAFIEVVEEVAGDQVDKQGRFFFKSLDFSGLILAIQDVISAEPVKRSMVPFIKDLTRLNLKKTQHREQTHDLSPTISIERPRLNKDYISIHEHDYLDLSGFLERLNKEGAANLKMQRTVYVFLQDEILTMPHATYRRTFKAFERNMSLNEYYELMARQELFDLAYHRELIDKLFDSGILS